MADRTAHRREIGFVVMGFPRISETFISNEILQLESLGARLRVFAIKRGDEDRKHESVDRIRAPIEYLPRASSLSGTGAFRWLRENLPRFRHAHGRVLRARPLAYLATLASALSMSLRYRKSRLAAPRKVFIKEFLQAGFIADQVLRAGTVAHLHGHFCHGATTITWFASRMSGVPFSFTAHAKDIYQADQNPGDLLARKLDAARFVSTCTDANRRHLAERFPHAKPVHTIYHGLDTGYFAPAHDGHAPHDPKDAEPLVLAVGRFVEKKGLRYLITALAQLQATGRGFRAVLVGEDGGEAPLLREMIEQAGLGGRVSLQGPMDHRALRALYSQAAVFALPCLVAADGDRDGIPNVIAEAMAMGIAIVTTDVSGIPEIVRDGHNGVLVPERDAPALAMALEKLLADPDRRRAIGAAARATICDCFDSSVTTRALLQLFEREMSKSPEYRCTAIPVAADA